MNFFAQREIINPDTGTDSSQAHKALGSMCHRDDDLLDIVQALSVPSNRRLLGKGLINQLNRKYLILKELLVGRIGLVDFWANILPDAFSTQLFPLSRRDQDAQIVFRILFGERDRDPLKLLDLRLHYLPSSELGSRDQYLHLLGAIALVQEIIISDQYAAHEFISGDAVVIDAGANIGVFSLLASSIMQRGRVYAFEPSALTFDLLRRNVVANHLQDRVFIYHQALGDSREMKPLRISQGILQTDNVMADSPFIQGREGGLIDTEMVEVITIDHLVEQEQINRIDFIKVDTEGYERKIILGAAQTIRRFSPTIVCSAYHLASDEEQIPQLIRSINPRYHYRLDRKDEKVLIFWV
ncbi:MAG: FkbM family methyltransferase [Patescibacteria group bacterium]